MDVATSRLNLASSSFKLCAASGSTLIQRGTANGQGLDKGVRGLPLLSGSPGLGSEKRNCSPNTTALIDNVGFQSSRRMLRQTLPRRSIFGWYT